MHSASDLPNFQKQGQTIRLWSGFPSFSLLDSYHSRYFPLFRPKNRRPFAPFTSGFAAVAEVEWSPDQCRGDPSADQPRRQAASRAAARGGRAGLLLSRLASSISREDRTADVGGIGWGLGV